MASSIWVNRALLLGLLVLIVIHNRRDERLGDSGAGLGQRAHSVRSPEDSVLLIEGAEFEEPRGDARLTDIPRHTEVSLGTQVLPRALEAPRSTGGPRNKGPPFRRPARALGRPEIPGAVKSVDLVISVCIEDLYWLSHFVKRSGMDRLEYRILLFVNNIRSTRDVDLIPSGCKSLESIQCPLDVAAKCKVMTSDKQMQENINKEAASYFSYVLKYKGNYSDIAIFTHGNPYVHTCTIEDDVHFLLQRPPESGYANLNWEFWNNIPCEAYLNKYFSDILPFRCCGGGVKSPCKKTISSFCCNQFLATRAKIQSIDIGAVRDATGAAKGHGIDNIATVFEMTWQAFMNVSDGDAPWSLAPPSMRALPFGQPDQLTPLENQTLLSCGVFARGPDKWKAGSVAFKARFHPRLLEQLSPYIISKAEKVYYLNTSYFPGLHQPPYKVGRVRHAARPMEDMINDMWNAMERYGRTYARLAHLLRAP